MGKAKNFSAMEIDRLLDVVERVLPSDLVHWDEVSRLFNDGRPIEIPERSVEALRRKFKTLKKVTTMKMNPGQTFPADSLRAERIYRTIKQRNSSVYVDDHIAGEVGANANILEVEGAETHQDAEDAATERGEHAAGAASNDEDANEGANAAAPEMAPATMPNRNSLMRKRQSSSSLPMHSEKKSRDASNERHPMMDLLLLMDERARQRELSFKREQDERDRKERREREERDRQAAADREERDRHQQMQIMQMMRDREEQERKMRAENEERDRRHQIFMLQMMLAVNNRNLPNLPFSSDNNPTSQSFTAHGSQSF